MKQTDSDYWPARVRFRNEPYSIRIDGVQYILGDEEPNNSRFRGFGGRLFKIRFHDDREISTTNLWYNGKIPEEYKKELWDNAVFICADGKKYPNGK